MKRTEKPGVMFCLLLRSAVAELAGVVMALCCDECDKTAAVAWSEKIMGVLDRVRGNRPGDTPMTWEDLRLFAGGAMRTLLKELESTDTCGGITREAL